MSQPEPLPPPPTAPAAGPPEPRDVVIRRAERQLLVLDRMVDLTMELAEALQRQAVAEALSKTRALEPVDGKDPAKAVVEPPHRPLNREPAETFVRVTRAVRLTLAMQMRLEEAIRVLREGPGPEATSRAATADRGANNAAGPGPAPFRDLRHHSEIEAETHAGKVRELVWDVINHEISDPIQGMQRVADLHERLMETETYDEFLFRPLREGVEAVCADLGLTPDWSRWTGEGWQAPTSRKEWQNCWAPRLRPPPRPTSTWRQPRDAGDG